MSPSFPMRCRRGNYELRSVIARDKRPTGIERHSGEARVDDPHKALGGLRVRIAAPRGRVDPMVADIVFDHLCDKPVERPSTGGDLPQNRRTLGLRVHRVGCASVVSAFTS